MPLAAMPERRVRPRKPEPRTPNRNDRTDRARKSKILTVFELRNTDCVLATERYHIICRSTPLLDLERCELKLA